MTIKQQGGIFGRNPTFNDVDVQDFTAATGTVSGNLTANALGVGTTAIEGKAIVEGSGVDVRIYNSDSAANGDSTALIRAYKSTGYWNDLRLSGSGIVFDTYTGERARITNDGLTFNGDTAAANALDDYEEGTWTPAFGGPSAVTYTQQSGRYTKIGRTVHVQAVIAWSALTPNVAVFLSGLPFNPDAGGNYINSIHVLIANNTNYNVAHQLFEGPTMYFYTGVVAGTASTNPFGSSGSIMLNGVYYT